MKFSVADSYDAVAEDYAEKFLRELDAKPFDRTLLDELAAELAGAGRVVDLGCGPGHVAAYLAQRGCDLLGIDLSPGMVAVAARLHPALEFRVGDMLDLALPDASIAGIAAFYSIIHLPRERVPVALGEMARVLAPGGHLALSAHRGRGELFAGEFLGRPVPFEATLFEPDELAGLVEGAGLVLDDVTVRAPYPEESATERIYLRARRPRAGRPRSLSA